MQKSEGQVALVFSSSVCQSICGILKKLWFVECILTTGARTSNLKPSPVPNLAPSLPQRLSTLSLSRPYLISPNKRKAVWGGGWGGTEPGKVTRKNGTRDKK